MLACSLKNARSIFLTGVPFPISKQTILRITTSNCVDEGLRWTCGITKSLMSHSLWLELFFSVRKNRRSAGVSRRFARWHSIMYRSIVLPMTKVGPIMLKSTPVWEIKQSASPLAYIVFTPSDSRCWFFFLFVSFLKNLCYVVSSSLFPEKPLSSESTIPLALFWWVLSLVDGPFQYPSKTTTGPTRCFTNSTKRLQVLSNNYSFFHWILWNRDTPSMTLIVGYVSDYSIRGYICSMTSARCGFVASLIIRSRPTMTSGEKIMHIAVGSLCPVHLCELYRQQADVEITAEGQCWLFLHQCGPAYLGPVAQQYPIGIFFYHTSCRKSPHMIVHIVYDNVGHISERTLLHWFLLQFVRCQKLFLPA